MCDNANANANNNNENNNTYHNNNDNNNNNNSQRLAESLEAPRVITARFTSGSDETTGRYNAHLLKSCVYLFKH